MKSKFIPLITILILAGCHSLSHRSTASDDPNGEWVSVAETVAKASSNINKLERGMSKAVVYKLMGTKTHYYKRQWRKPTTITHPYKREIIDNSGKTYEILYYYTAYQKRDGALTPVILLDDKVLGWGWNYYNSKLNN